MAMKNAKCAVHETDKKILQLLIFFLSLAEFRTRELKF